MALRAIVTPMPVLRLPVRFTWRALVISLVLAAPAAARGLLLA
jgi:hypothetical protein